MVKNRIYISTYHTTGDVNVLVEMAQLTEESGWDEFFLWDHLYPDDEVYSLVDPWITLAAIAA